MLRGNPREETGAAHRRVDEKRGNTSITYLCTDVQG